MLVKIVAVQTQPGRQLTLEEKLHIFRHRPDFVCLPEFFGMAESTTDFRRAALAMNEQLEQLAQLSDELDTTLIGGSLIEAGETGLYNMSPIFHKGRLIHQYRKVNPVPGELARGLIPGQELSVVEIGGLRVGQLLCGDVFYEQNFHKLAELEPDLIFIPTSSPFRPADSLTQKKERDRKFFQAGSTLTGAYVIKVCGVGTLMGKPLQGRSLICAPWELLLKVNAVSEGVSRILSITLDIDELREFRQRMKKVIPSQSSAITSIN